VGLRAAVDLLAGAFAPRRCAGCETVAEDPICAGCLARLELLPSPRIKREGLGAIWIAAYEYRDPLRAIVHAAKYRGCRPALDELARAAAARVVDRQGLAGDALVPVTLGPRRARQRGYNQSEVFARALERETSLPVVLGLVRVRDTRAQSERNEEARWRNVEGAFAWRGAGLGGARLWLVDDVVTTGATLSAASAALAAAGASIPSVVTIAAVP